MGKQKAHRRLAQILGERLEAIESVPEKAKQKPVYARRKYFRRVVFDSCCPVCGRAFKKKPTIYAVYVCKECCSVYKFVRTGEPVKYTKTWDVVGKLVEIMHIPWNQYMISPEYHVPIVAF